MHNIDNELDPSVSGFVAPPVSFRGAELAKYGPARKILFHQGSLNENGDRNSRGWASLALIYLLTLSESEASRQAFNRSEFRTNALAWFDQFEDADAATVEIADLADAILSRAEQTKVEVGSTGGTDPKNA